MNADTVVIRHSLIDPPPCRVREHPERHADPRGTCVRETLVALAVHYPPTGS